MPSPLGGNLESGWKMKKTRVYIQWDSRRGSLLKTGGAKPFFAFLNEKGAINVFRKAIRKGSYEEAQRFISRSIEVDMDEVFRLFDKRKHYKPLFRLSGGRKSGIRTVSLLFDGSAREDIIHMSMVREGGEWRILQIMKE